MTTMLEKAVAAIHDAPREKGDAFDVGDVAARNIARAVLLAIREPEGRARSVGADAIRRLCPNSSLYVDGSIARQVFTAMTDAILAGETET